MSTLEAFHLLTTFTFCSDSVSDADDDASASVLASVYAPLLSSLA